MNNLVGLTLTLSTGTTLLILTIVRSWLGKAGDPSTRDNFLHINGALVVAYLIANFNHVTRFVQSQVL